MQRACSRRLIHQPGPLQPCSTPYVSLLASTAILIDESSRFMMDVTVMLSDNRGSSNTCGCCHRIQNQAVVYDMVAIGTAS